MVTTHRTHPSHSTKSTHRTHRADSTSSASAKKTRSTGDSFGRGKSGHATAHHASGSHGEARTNEVAIRAARIPASWTKYLPGKAAAIFAKIDSNGETLNYRTRGGKEISLDSASYAALAKKGEITLYKNPHDLRGDPDDDTGRIGPWIPAYHITVGAKSPLAAIAKELDALVTKAAAVSDTGTKGLEAFHQVIHAARVQEQADPNIAKIKHEVDAARPVAARVIADYEVAVADWTQKKDALLKKDMTNDERALVTAVLEAGKPEIQGGLGIKIDEAKGILKIDDVIYHRPEVLSIDPGFDSIRIEIDVPKFIANGGNMAKYTENLKALLEQHGVHDAFEVERHDHIDALMQHIAKDIVGPVIGQDNIQQWGYSGSDSEKGAKLELDVKPAFVDQAKTLLPQIKALLGPYAFQNFGDTVDIKSIDR